MGTWAEQRESWFPGFRIMSRSGGNRRADVLADDADREAYLRYLQQYTAWHGLYIWVYCLMTNRMHLVFVPAREESLSRVLRP